MKGTLAAVVRALFGEETRYRFKPKYYPYTEPSLGMDIVCTSCGERVRRMSWGGLGDHHWCRNGPSQSPQTLRLRREVGGFAFGWGVTRCSQVAGISKVRSLYEPDLRLLQALHRGRST